MSKRHLKRLSITLGLPMALGSMLMTACASISAGIEDVSATLKFYNAGRKVDTGVVDYRIYHEDTATLAYHFVPAWCIVSNDLVNGKSGADHRSELAVKCPHGFVPEDRVLKAGDSVSINLMYGFICDFYERAESRRELFRGYNGWSRDKDQSKPCVDIRENRAGTRGEIAVLATAFERGGDRKIVYQADAIGDKAARMVYYSDDIRETGQPLNFSNLPVYGPVSYGGKPFFLRLYVVELDTAEVKASGTILRSLADLGAKSYPPASPVLSALTKVGDAFLENQQDDSLLQYDMVLDGQGGQGTVSAPLASGIAVFVRVQDRMKPFPWDKYCVRLTTGRVYVKAANTTASNCGDNDEKELSGHTYFTVQVKRNESALDQDLYQTFQEFSDAKQDSSQAAQVLASKLSELTKDVMRTARVDRARTLAPFLIAGSQAQQREAREAFMFAICPQASSAGTGNEATDASTELGLPRDQIFYLLKLVEQQSSLAINIDSLLSSDGACSKVKDNWKEVDALFAK